MVEENNDKQSLEIPKDLLTIKNYAKANDIPTNTTLVIINAFVEDSNFIDKETKQPVTKTNYVLQTEHKGKEWLISCNKKTLIRLSEDFKSSNLGDWIGQKVRLLNMEDSGFKYILLVADSVAVEESDEIIGDVQTEESE